MIDKCWKAFFFEACYWRIALTMNKTSCIELGVIQRKQGLQGAVVARLYQEVPRLDTLKSLFVQINHTLVPYGIEQFSLQHDRVIIKLQGIDDATAAHDLKGCTIFVPQELLPELFDSPAQFTQLIGYQVVDVKEGQLGMLQDIYQPAQQYLLAVDYDGQELLIPYHEDIVTDVDHSRQSIEVQLPKGFIESAF